MKENIEKHYTSDFFKCHHTSILVRKSHTNVLWTICNLLFMSCNCVFFPSAFTANQGKKKKKKWQQKCTWTSEKGYSLLHRGHTMGMTSTRARGWPLPTSLSTGTGSRRPSSCALGGRPPPPPRWARAALPPRRWPRGSCCGRPGRDRLKHTKDRRYITALFICDRIFSFKVALFGIHLAPPFCENTQKSRESG